MKKTSTLGVSIFVLTCFLTTSFRLHAQNGPRARVDLVSTDSYDSAFIGSQTPVVYVYNVSNDGDEPLTYTISFPNHDFTRGSLQSTYTLLPHDGEQYMHAFRPTSPGRSTSVVTITTNDPNNEIITFEMQGYGLEFPLTNVEQLTDNFQLGTISTRQIELKNTTPNKAEFQIIPFAQVADFFTIPVDTYVLEPGQSVLVDVILDFSDFDSTDSGELPTVFTSEFELGVYYRPFYQKEMDMFGSPTTTISIVADYGSASMQITGPTQIQAKISTVSSTSFEITNSGNSPLNYSIDTDSLITQVDGVRLYSTGFDEFESGIAQLQGGWSEVMYVFYITENNQWTIESANPYNSAKHLRCTTNGRPESNGVDLYSPIPPENTTVIDMMVDVNPGATWQFVVSDQQYYTRTLFINANGSLGILKEYSNDVIQSIPGTLPDGYFNLRFVTDALTQEFKITADDVVLYSESANSTSFTTFYINLNSETAGAILDIDNFRFMNNENVHFLSVEQESGTIEPLSSKTINVKVDTRSIDSGTFSEIFTIHSNDPTQPIAYVPVSTVVKPNVLPVLTGNFNPTMVSGESLLLTFSTIDPDDSLVSVTFDNFNGSVAGGLVEVASGNGFATYDFVTYENANSDGILTMTIIAKDARGGIRSKLVTIKVLASGQNDFSLTNFKTGIKAATFTDTITVDVAHPDFEKLTIQANASVEAYEGWNEAVGFRFTVDGVEVNRDVSKPFYLTKGFIQKLSEGYHSFTAISFYVYEGTEYKIGTGISTIRVINSAEVIRYDVVNRNGVKVMDLTEGSVIDLSKIGTSEFNIIAHTNISSVRSVKFALNTVTTRIDNGAPYALAGNVLGDTFWKPKAGQYTLTATPYLQYYGWGIKGVPLTVHFQVVNGVAAKPSSTIARSETSTDVQHVFESIDAEIILSVYPVPVIDELHIALHESINGNVIVNIMNAQGQSVHTREGLADEFRMYYINTVQLGMSRGVYFVIVNQANGKRVVKKFIKE